MQSSTARIMESATTLSEPPVEINKYGEICHDFILNEPKESSAVDAKRINEFSELVDKIENDIKSNKNLFQSAMCRYGLAQLFEKCGHTTHQTYEKITAEERFVMWVTLYAEVIADIRKAEKEKKLSRLGEIAKAYILPNCYNKLVHAFPNWDFARSFPLAHQDNSMFMQLVDKAFPRAARVSPKIKTSKNTIYLGMTGLIVGTCFSWQLGFFGGCVGFFGKKIVNTLTENCSKSHKP